MDEARTSPAPAPAPAQETSAASTANAESRLETFIHDQGYVGSLVELRKKFADIPKSEFDRALLALKAKQRVFLMGSENSSYAVADPENYIFDPENQRWAYTGVTPRSQ